MGKILIIIPHDRFRDEELESVRKFLTEAKLDFEIGSSHHTEAQGHFGLLVKPDVDVRFVEEDDYSGLIFIGGRGIEEYLLETSITNLVRRFFYEGKIIAAIGMAVEILAYAGILSGRRVACDNTTIPKVQNAGAYYTGNLVEEDGSLITGSGVAAKDDFAETIVAAFREKKGAIRARTA